MFRAAVSIIFMMSIVALGTYTLCSAPSLVIAQTTTSDNDFIMKNIHLSQFSLKPYSVFSKLDPKYGPLWNVAVTIAAPPQVLNQIEKVVYIAYNEPPSIKPYTSRNATYNFYFILLNQSAGPIIKASVYFRDGQVLSKTIQTSVQCTPDICPIQVSLSPKMIGLDEVTIRGNVTTKYGWKVTTLHIAWGEKNGMGDVNGNYTNYPMSFRAFAFNHTYPTPASYTINLTIGSNHRITFHRFVTTTALLLERSLPRNSSVGIDVAADGLLNVTTSQDTLQEIANWI